MPRASGVKKSASRKEKLQSTLGTRPVYWGVVFLWLLFAGTIVYVLLFSPYLALVTVDVEGAHAEESAPIDAFLQDQLSGKYLKVFPKNDLFLVFPHRLEQQLLNEYPLIQQVSVTRVFPHTLKVDIVSREKLVLWCSAGVCSQIREDGSVVARTAAFDRPLNQARTLTIHDMSEKPLPQESAVFPSTYVPFVTSLKESFRNRLGIEIEDSFSVASRFANELRCKTNEGWEVFLNTEQPLESSLDSLDLLFEKEVSSEKRPHLKYVDLRTVNRIYYASVDGAEPTEVTVDQKEEQQKTSSTEKKEDKKETKKKK